ncbi:MAG: hypothetical protein CME15_02665 [Gemmatimonadetes bacterium]|nr:hypothetical protein [Gemmatimonadota bacterium]
MMRSLSLRLILTTAALLLVSHPESRAQNLVFDSSDFASWDHPVGLVNVLSDRVEVKRFGKTFNAVTNADRLSSSIIGDWGLRPVRSPSNQFLARRVADQENGTWWQPDPDDALQQWWVEIDLGRAVVADKVRVIFPDTDGARPFSFFSVYVSPGIPVFGGRAKRIVFNRLGRPVNNNTETVVEFDLKTTNIASATAENMVTGSTLDFDVVRFVRFAADGMTADAALAEIEVDGVGFNLSGKVGTASRIEKGEAHWGGRTWTSKDRDCYGCSKGSGSDALLDEDLGFRSWNIETVSKPIWRDAGTWSVVDFGTVYRVDRIIWMPIVGGRGPFLYGFQRDKQGAWGNFGILVSDGTPSSRADPAVEGPFDYDLLSEVENRGRYLFDYQFEPRALRLLMWRVIVAPQFSRAVQLFVFHSEGYPVQVELESADLSLGGARSIRRVEWDADVPPGTSIEVETQTGNGFQAVKKYFLKNGKEVTKAAYDGAKSRNRGDIVEEEVRDASWSSWSLAHRFSGEEFKSPSPRTWLRVRVHLISRDPELMPTLRSLTFVAKDPVISAGLSGQIFPREAFLDSLQAFRYTIKPAGFSGRDPGFDQVLIALPPGSGDTELVSATVGGVVVDATAVVRGDSLIVQLPPPLVRRDSVEINFMTRLFQSPTVFGTLVANSSNEDNAQGVVPVEFAADQVFVPAAVNGGSLVRNVTHTAAFTPNRDGSNDDYELSFTLVKTRVQPRVRIYSLNGRQVAELVNTDMQSSRPHYVWDGISDDQIVPPGVYLMIVEVETDARKETVQKLVHVVY